MLRRWEPVVQMDREFNRLRGELDRLFGRYGGRPTQDLGVAAYPLLNMWEDDNHLYVEAELPGFELDNLEVYVTGGNQLSLKGERKRPEREGGTWHRQERGYGSFNRVVELPSGVDSGQVSADFKHGVLTITLAKSEEVKPRRIEVKSS